MNGTHPVDNRFRFTRTLPPIGMHGLIPARNQEKEQNRRKKAPQVKVDSAKRFHSEQAIDFTSPRAWE